MSELSNDEFYVIILAAAFHMEYNVLNAPLLLPFLV
jgi:hypothetical protein